MAVSLRPDAEVSELRVGFGTIAEGLAPIVCGGSHDLFSDVTTPAEKSHDSQPWAQDAHYYAHSHADHASDYTHNTHTLPSDTLINVQEEKWRRA